MSLSGHALAERKLAEFIHFVFMTRRLNNSEPAYPWDDDMASLTPSQSASQRGAYTPISSGREYPPTDLDHRAFKRSRANVDNAGAEEPDPFGFPYEPHPSFHTPWETNTLNEPTATIDPNALQLFRTPATDGLALLDTALSTPVAEAAPALPGYQQPKPNFADYSIPSEDSQKAFLDDCEHMRGQQWKFWHLLRILRHFAKPGRPLEVDLSPLNENHESLRSALKAGFNDKRSPGGTYRKIKQTIATYKNMLEFHSRHCGSQEFEYDRALPKEDVIGLINTQIQSAIANGFNPNFLGEEYYAWTYDRSKGLFAIMHRGLPVDTSDQNMTDTPSGPPAPSPIQAGSSVPLPHAGNMDYREMGAIIDLEDKSSGVTSNPDSSLRSRSLIGSGTPPTSAPYKPHVSTAPSPSLLLGQDSAFTQEEAMCLSSEMLNRLDLYGKATDIVLKYIASQTTRNQANADQAIRLLSVPGLSEEQKEAARQQAFDFPKHPTPEEMEVLVQAQMKRMSGDMRRSFPAVAQFINPIPTFSRSPPTQSHSRTGSLLARAINNSRVSSGSPSSIPPVALPTVSDSPMSD
ncbi:hypothetical protein RSOLAG22IIIB_11172 [Rhizoctonia solani]|uniref:Uncharacterized protein n=1 Tax=Rhizoctonia solani TaxID=456999 RepID=A0A0K6G6X6_9AGAM|nr:hypothetical protein RSOLAG22IIIB_11172 [Rhizoctonia solani]